LDQATYPEVVANRSSLWAGSPIDASLFGLALRGVCLAAHVTTRAGALLPHRFTHHPLGLVCFLLHLSSPSSRSRQAPRR